MRLPGETSSCAQRVRFGRYVATRLRRTKNEALAKNVTVATDDMKASNRAFEDAEEAEQAVLADRDAADDDLDTTAQETRLALASRSLTATGEEPYTLIFPDGIGYYTAATLDQEIPRYREFSTRLEAHLPASDPVRKKAVGELKKGLQAYEEAKAAVDDARGKTAMAGTRLQKSTEAWERVMERTYGALVTEVGRAAAERFFPRFRRGGRAEPSPTPPAPPPA